MHYNFGDTARFDGTVPTQLSYVFGNASQTLRYFDDEKTRHFDAVHAQRRSGGPQQKLLRATAILRVIGPWASRPERRNRCGFIISNFATNSACAASSPPGRTWVAAEDAGTSYKAQVNRCSPCAQCADGLRPDRDSHRNT